ncbi:MAG: hypothetical protein AB7O28_10755 [Vicinamibacterales bacterium]
MARTHGVRQERGPAGRRGRAPAPRRRRALVALAIAASLADLGTNAAAAAQPEREPRLTEQWLDAVERHVPGTVDPALLGAAGWSSENLRGLTVGIQIVLQLASHPERSRIRVRPLDFTGRASGAPSFVVTLRGANQEEMRGLAERVRRRGRDDTLKRAVLLHTDLVTLATDIVSATAGPASMTAPVRVNVGDGTSAGAENMSLHWELARTLLTLVEPAPSADPFVRDWYRATLALGQSTEFFDSLHLRWALEVLPEDPVILMLAGCEHEAFASPFFQALARAVRRAPARLLIGSSKAELERAERYFREALARDASLAEARIRLGHVLGGLGRHADSLRELSQALGPALEPALEYYAMLFMGTAQEAQGDAAAATAAFTRAAALAAGARAPRLALARLAREAGDRDESTRQLARALAAPNEADGIDPWWRYRGIRGQGSASWLDTLRRAWAAPAR